MGKEERLIYPDIAKGLGIVAVLCAHTQVGVIWVQPYYMPMFFAVSGCIFEFLNKNAHNCIRSFAKMVVSYFKYSVIVALIYIPLFFIKHKDPLFIVRNIVGIFYARKALCSPLELENNIIFMEFGNGPMWFLVCLALAWIFYIPLIYCKHRFYCAIVVIALYMICGSVLGSMKIMFPWSVDTAFIAAIFIFFGTKYERVRRKYLLDSISGGYKRVRMSIAFGACFLVYFVLVKRISIGWNMSVGTYDTSISSGVIFFCLFSMLGTVMLLLLCCLTENLPIANILKYVGNKSLPILCFHAVVYQYIEVVNGKLNLSQYSWYAISKILVAIVVSILLDKSITTLNSKFSVHVKGKRRKNENL